MNDDRIPLLNPYAELAEILRKESVRAQLQLRKKLIWAYSWAIPSNKAIVAMTRHSPILELGAGTGYWAWLLRQAGANVAAFDRDPAQPPRWTEVSSGDESVVSGFPNHALLLCWPPLESSMAERALVAFRGSVVLYVGEWRGRTGDAEFHKRLDSDWRKIEEIELPVWPGFQDKLHIFGRVDDLTGSGSVRVDF